MGSILVVSVGIYSVAWWPMLPSLTLYVAVCIAVSLACGGYLAAGYGSKPWVSAPTKILLLLIWGSCWGLMSAHQVLGQQLPVSMERETFWVSGHIVGLVDTNAQRSRFRFVVESIDGVEQSQSGSGLKLLALSWYQRAPQKLSPGEYWQLRVRLRRPRGLLNSGTFDYKSWLIQQGVSATGYVIANDANRLIINPDPRALSRFRSWVDLWRSQLGEKISKAPLSDMGRGIILALSVGDKRLITQHWDRLAQLGIVHLMVISGLHIGLVAGFGFVLGSGLSRLLAVLLVSRLVSIGRWLPPLTGLLAAVFYSQLAGFSLSTQRALIAVSLVMLGKLAYRRIRPLACIAWALLLIAMSQPLAVLNTGFWLSFVAVILLVFWFFPWQSKREFGLIRRTVLVQVALMLGLLVPSLFFMGRASWLAPLVNLVAVPWVSMVTVPLSLMASLLVNSWPQIGTWLWQLADYSVLVLWHFLELLPLELGFITSPFPLNLWLFAAAIIAICGTLTPAGLGVRLVCWVPIISLITASVPESPLRVTVLDVGQGLAVVVEAPHHVLVYDTGPKYSERLNAGSDIVAPFLRARGRSHIDRLVISHRDNDHAGGFEPLLNETKVRRLLIGPSVGHPASRMSAPDSVCRAGQVWSWPINAAVNEESIEFRILAPQPDLLIDPDQSANNSSCVLLIRWRDQVILLPGDIEKPQEIALVAQGLLPKVTLLVAPHHGSKTSSIDPFVEQLRPNMVVFSSGYRHHFGHPHGAVVDRYQRVGSSLWYTAHQGGLSFIWDRDGTLRVVSARQSMGNFWWR